MFSLWSYTAVSECTSMAFAELSRLILWWQNIFLSYLISYFDTESYQNVKQPKNQNHPTLHWKKLLTLNETLFLKCQGEMAVTGKRGPFSATECPALCTVHLRFWKILKESEWCCQLTASSLWWGLFPPPHKLVGFSILVVLGSCWEGRGLLVPPQGFTWPWLLQSWQDKQATSIPVTWPHPFKGICCMCPT